jgi:hypothetical protein
MKSDQALDRAILEIVKQHQPVTMIKIVDLMDRLDDHRRGKKSNRGITERVYRLKRDGALVLQGERQAARYTLPSYSGSAQTEAQRQAAEGQRREAPPAPAAPVVVVVDPEAVAPEGWTYLHGQLAQEIERVEEEQEIMPTPPPPAPSQEEMQPIVKRAPLSISISSLAGDVAAQVAMTVERVVGQDIARYEAQIADLHRQLRDRDHDIAEALTNQRAAEQLAEEAERKYTELRAAIAKLQG